MISSYSGFSSIPTAARPTARAAARVVPEPANGSRTTAGRVSSVGQSQPLFQPTVRVRVMCRWGSRLPMALARFQPSASQVSALPSTDLAVTLVSRPGRVGTRSRWTWRRRGAPQVAQQPASAVAGFGGVSAPDQAVVATVGGVGGVAGMLGRGAALAIGGGWDLDRFGVVVVVG